MDFAKVCGSWLSVRNTPISADDVLDVHDLLGDFEGDVHQLMARFEGKVR